MRERYSLKNNDRERKWLIVSIPTTKVIKFDVQIFRSIMGIGWCWLLAFKLAKKVNRGLERVEVSS
jgi:hypothetical protein